MIQVIQISEKQMKEYFEWLKKPKGVYYQINFAGLQGLTDVKLPLVKLPKSK